MRIIAAMLAVSLISMHAAAQTSEADLFIGTLSLDQGEVILSRCDIANNRYVLRDDAETKSDAVAKFRAAGTPAYGEVIGRYFEEAGRSGLVVLQIENLTPGRNCHLVSAVNALFSQLGDGGPDESKRAPALWLGPEAFTATDITRLSMDFDVQGMAVLDIVLDPKAGDRLAAMTGQNMGREIDLRLHDRVIKRVVLVEAINEGRLRISGRNTVLEIKQLMRDMFCTLSLSEAVVPGLSKKERRCPPPI